MNELIAVNQQLPASLEDLSRFALVGREKLVAVRAAIRAIDKVEVAREVREQKLREGQEIAEAVLDAEVRIGELTAKVPKATKGAGGNRYQKAPVRENDTVVDFSKPKAKVIQDIGLTQKQVERFEAMAAHPDIVAKAKADARERDEIVTRADVLKEVQAQKKRDQVLQAERSIAEQAEQKQTPPILYLGDSTGLHLSEPCDLLLTDPPYMTDVADINVFVSSWLYRALQNVKPTGFAYIFIGAYPDEVGAYSTARIPEHMHLEQLLVWTYKNTLGQNPKDRYKLNYQHCLFFRGVDAPALDCPLTSEQWAVQEINAPDGRQGDRYHAWQKPMEIAVRFILAGIRPIWASEVAPFPIRVTTKRMPDVKHYGDVSRLKGGDLEAVDIITFGSP